jgi:AraC-like DNA-binding protein
MSLAAISDLVDVTEVDSVARPVIAKASAWASSYWEQAQHRHRKGQLLYAVRGLLKCETGRRVWIVPPGCAVWIPGNQAHSLRGSGEMECYCLFVEPDAAPALPGASCTISVSSLLRELLAKAAHLPNVDHRDGPEVRLMATLLDELSLAPSEELHLPIPRDPRLRRLTENLIASPAEKMPMRDWAHCIGMSERNMSRTLLSETGMTFGAWRRQLHVILAIQRLARGESVQRVALELGYESPSGFVTMFRLAVGQPPARYLFDRYGGSSASR